MALRPDAPDRDGVCPGGLATFLPQSHEGHKPPGPVLHPAGPVSSDLRPAPNPLCPVRDDSVCPCYPRRWVFEVTSPSHGWSGPAAVGPARGLCPVPLGQEVLPPLASRAQGGCACFQNQRAHRSLAAGPTTHQLTGQPQCRVGVRSVPARPPRSDPELVAQACPPRASCREADLIAFLPSQGG